MLRNWILASVTLLFLTACARFDTAIEPNAAPIVTKPTPTPEPIVIDLDQVPPVDQSKHSVPLASIQFDTFRGDFVPLPEADADLVRRLRDAIPPIYEPKFETVPDADKWMFNNDFVVGYVDGDEAYAYPFKIMNFHEIVTHTVNGRPILATY